MDEETLSDLAAALVCSQCGKTFNNYACGPTHALIAADPARHRLIATVVDSAVADKTNELLGLLKRASEQADEALDHAKYWRGRAQAVESELVNAWDKGYSSGQR